MELVLGLSFDAKFRRIAKDPRATAGQKMILSVLALYPEGCTLYQIMEALADDKNRRTTQRRLEWLIDTGRVIASHQRPAGAQKPIIYKLGDRLW